tara:strand:- start:217 stop:366 length:150 start_codon:yes stop_codon:yes gene_type:complete
MIRTSESSFQDVNFDRKFDIVKKRPCPGGTGRAFGGARFKKIVPGVLCI